MSTATDYRTLGEVTMFHSVYNGVTIWYSKGDAMPYYAHPTNRSIRADSIDAMHRAIDSAVSA